MAIVLAFTFAYETERLRFHCTALYIHGWYATIMLNMIHQVVLNYTWAGVVLPPNQAAIAKWALRLE
jgi:hypothetical protein